MNPNLEFLDARDCLFLLVDVQKSMLDLCVDTDRVTAHAAALIDTAGLFEVPLLFTAHNPEKLGGVLPELTGRVPGAPVLPKMEFNSFENEAIARAVAQTGRKTIILAGLEGHVCIFHTGAGALGLGYRVHVVSDAVTSRSARNKEVGLNRLARAGAVVSSTEMVLFELLKRAGTPEFRAALPLIKSFLR